MYPDNISIQENGQLTRCASIVAINVYYLNEFRHLSEQLDVNSDHLLSLSFQLAITLCHELAHAMNFAVNLDLLRRLNVCNPRERKAIPFTEPFVDDKRITELGLRWENEVFGGVMMTSLESLNEPLFVYGWPLFLARNVERSPERAGPGRISTTYLISIYYIRNIQSQVSLRCGQTSSAYRQCASNPEIHWNQT